MSLPLESLWAKTDVPRASATLNSRLQLRLPRHSSSTDKRSKVVHVGLTSHPTKSQHSVVAVAVASVVVAVAASVTVEVVVVSVVAVEASVTVVVAEVSAVAVVASVIVEVVVASEVVIAVASEVVIAVVAVTSAMLSTRTRATSLLSRARRLSSEFYESGDKAVVKVQMI